MDSKTEIKEKLNAIYKEYKDNKSQLNGEKTKNAAKLIVEMTFSDNGNPSDVAAELARFSADIVKVYFEQHYAAFRMNRFEYVLAGSSEQIELCEH